MDSLATRVRAAERITAAGGSLTNTSYISRRARFMAAAVQEVCKLLQLLFRLQIVYVDGGQNVCRAAGTQPASVSVPTS